MDETSLPEKSGGLAQSGNYLKAAFALFALSVCVLAIAIDITTHRVTVQCTVLNQYEAINNVDSTQKRYISPDMCIAQFEVNRKRYSRLYATRDIPDSGAVITYYKRWPVIWWRSRLLTILWCVVPLLAIGGFILLKIARQLERRRKQWEYLSKKRRKTIDSTQESLPAEQAPPEQSTGIINAQP